jgi:ABC-type phosphate transport system substrate-binding protein
MKLKSLAAATIAASTLVMSAGVAHATSPEPSGWDDVLDVIKGGGSDTTYNLNQKIGILYNQGSGCEQNTTYVAGNPATAGTYGNCLAPANNSTDTKGNWDHDVTVEEWPTGSSAGVKELIAGTVDYARSSRGPNATGETGNNFWAIGKDALAFVTWGNRTAGNLTKAQLQGIYNCTITTWDQITGNSADATETIEPVGMQSSSGTYATFKSFLGFEPNAGACVKKLDDPDGAGPAAAIYAFENDLKPVIAQTGINDNNAIWWMSWANFRAFSYKRQTAVAWNVDSKSLTAASVSNNTWPATRFIYHVTKNADAAPDASTDNVLGADTGKGGAVREYTEFMCKTSVNHSVNEGSGLSNYDELTKAYTDTGFLRVPSTERTTGICKVVAAP